MTTMEQAMTLVPKVLVSRCTTIAAIEKIACVRPEGRPSRMIREVMPRSGSRSLRLRRSVSFMCVSRQRQRSAETPCAMTVASATPAAAMSNLATNRMSSAMLSRQAMIRKTSGENESPRPRSTPEMML